MNQRQPSGTMRICMALIASLAWFALVLQFALSIGTSRANGIGLPGAVVTYLSFFTILTNLLVALGVSFALCAPNSKAGIYFSRPDVTSATAIYIAFVGVSYSLLLRHIWDPEGMQKAADIILHDAVPMLYVLFWLVFLPKAGLRWKNVGSWMIYPLLYLAWVLIRGAVSGRYPYPFIDVGALGYARVSLNAIMLLCAFTALSLVVISASRWLARKRNVDVP